MHLIHSSTAEGDHFRSTVKLPNIYLTFCGRPTQAAVASCIYYCQC